MLLGEVVHEERIRQGLSLRELAEKCGLSAMYILRLERGDFESPRPATVRALADGLGMLLAILHRHHSSVRSFS